MCHCMWSYLEIKEEHVSKGTYCELISFHVILNRVNMNPISSRILIKECNFLDNI